MPTPRVLRLGSLRLDVPAIQGALSGYSDLPMRRVARAFGCVYAMNEVVLDELVVLPGKLQEQILRVADDDHPVGGQILGATPETFAAAAALMVSAGYDVVDVNFGCPVKKTVGRCRGGYLLSEPETALDILARVRDAVRPGVPVTVKMRRGIDDADPASEEKFWRILDGAFARGIDAVCVHARTVTQRYVGPARRSFLREVKRAHPTRTILGSGDVFHARDVVDLLEGHGVDGAWIGRGAIGAPWVFAEVEHLLRTGEERAPPTFNEQRRALWMHHREAVALYGRELGNRFFRSAAMKYAEAHPRAQDAKDALHAAKNCDDVEAALARFWDEAYGEEHFGPVVAKSGPGHLVAAGARL
jgi:tRNA-dihydrouridine synthase B